MMLVRLFTVEATYADAVEISDFSDCNSATDSALATYYKGRASKVVLRDPAGKQVCVFRRAVFDENRFSDHIGFVK